MEENHDYPFGQALESDYFVGGANPYRYNGKERVDAFDLGWYDYGQRMFDPGIGRFLRLDRFAENYMSLSPYQFVANNPLSNIDINGESIWVVVFSTVNNQIESQAYYWGADQNGNYSFKDQSGNSYQGGDQFVADVTNGLNSLMSGGSVGNSLVTGLANASDNVQILPSAASNSEFPTNTPSTFDSYVRWNPNNGGIIGNERPSFVGLGHELAHSRDRFNNALDASNWFSYQDAQGNTQYIRSYEIPATHTENQIRAENNLPLRPSYGFDQNGSPNGGSIIFHGTRQSRYYDSSGKPNPGYKPINRNKQTPYTY